MNKYNIKILASAFKDLENIFIFYNYNLNHTYAYKLILKIIQEIYSLKIFPYSNPIYHIQENIVLRKRLVYKRYLIIFEVASNFILIYHVFDGRRNLNPAKTFKNI